MTTARDGDSLMEAPLERICEMPTANGDSGARFRSLFERHEQATEFVGLTIDEAQVRAKQSGVVQVRVIDADTPEVTIRLDHRPKRLNLVISGTEVVEAAFF